MFSIDDPDLGTEYTFFDGFGISTRLNREFFDPGYFTTVNTFAVAERIGPEPIPEPVSGLAVLAIGAMVAGGALKQSTNS